jgi:DNA-binding transcriptional LysR family regulator
MESTNSEVKSLQNQTFFRYTEKRRPCAEAAPQPARPAHRQWLHGACHTGADREFARPGVDRRVTVAVPDLTTLVELARAGPGLATLPLSLSGRQLSGRQLPAAAGWACAAASRRATGMTSLTATSMRS